MWILYDFISWVICLVYLPFYLCKRKFHHGFSRRLGRLPLDISFQQPIWIHAVSVGEAIVVKPLIQRLREVYPQKKFVISTVTPTGNKIAAGLAKEGDFVTYLPLDISFIVLKVIRRVNPSMFIIIETEIWPNLISCLHKQGVPVAVVNSRISDRSFKGYSFLSFLLKPVLNKVNLFCAQTDKDARRLIALGLSADKVCVTGNMKFDNADTAEGTDAVKVIDKTLLGISKEQKLFVAGSTHHGEDEIILEAYKGLLLEFPFLRLLLAPRHPDRAKELLRTVSEFGFLGICISSLNEPVSKKSGENAVFILDVIGKLVGFYSAGDIIFVGGSLISKGGHNIIEPAVFAKPILHGPYMFNFRDIADLFQSRNASIKVNNSAELKDAAGYLMKNPAEAEALGKRAERILVQNRGAAKKNVECIMKIAREIKSKAIEA